MIILVQPLSDSCKERNPRCGSDVVPLLVRHRVGRVSRFFPGHLSWSERHVREVDMFRVSAGLCVLLRTILVR
jgi:hypothetical protein